MTAGNAICLINRDFINLVIEIKSKLLLLFTKGVF